MADTKIVLVLILSFPIWGIIVSIISAFIIAFLLAKSPHYWKVFICTIVELIICAPMVIMGPEGPLFISPWYLAGIFDPKAIQFHLGLFACALVLFVVVAWIASRISSYKPDKVKYYGLRNNVFYLTASQLGLEGTKKSRVLAVLMETDYLEAATTLVAVSDGSASIYFSNGGEIIGAGECAEVRKESLSLIALAEKYLGLMKKTYNYALPKKGYIRFYVVTDGGVLTSEVLENDLRNNKSNLSPVFYQGHRLFTAIRETEQRRTTEPEVPADAAEPRR